MHSIVRISCLKIKPPQIQWPPIATVGAAASIGSGLGSLQIQIWNKEWFVMTLAFSVVVCVAGVILSSLRVRITCVALSIFLLCFARASQGGEQHTAPWTTLMHGELVKLRCVITSDPKVFPRTKGEMSQFDYRLPSTRFVARATPAQSSNAQWIVSVIEVRINGTSNVQQDDEITCTGWLRNSKHGLHGTTLYVPSVSVVQIMHREMNTPLILRSILRNKLISELPDVQKALANAIFFGVRDGAWQEVSLMFRKAGMSHILAISGLHIGLIVLLTMYCATRLRLNNTKTIMLLLIVSVVILFLIEARSPAIRAIVMSLIVSSSKLFGFRCSTVGLLGIAALALITFHPQEAVNVGFQLSFLVVTSLCVLLPQIKWRFLGPRDVNSSTMKAIYYWFASMWITGLCAWVIASPITAHIFGSVSPSGLLSNIPGIGMLVLTLVIGICRMCIGWVIDPPLFELLSQTLEYFLHVASSFSTLPFAHVDGIHISLFWVFVLLLWAVYWSCSIKRRRLVWLLGILITVSISAEKYSFASGVIVTTLDVGHGTCHIIQNGARTMMIDGGSRHNLDVGANMLIPKLRDLGVRSIETLIITHSDLDHLVGLIDVMHVFQVDKILVAMQTKEHETAPLQSILTAATHLGIPVIEVSNTWSENFGSSFISILSPSATEEYRSANAVSIVLLLEAHQRNIIFTGDVDEKKISELFNTFPAIVDVIELPHHGQWSKESQALIDYYVPSVVLQSTNIARHKKDKWTFPYSTQRLVTAVDGTITTTILPDGTINVIGSACPVTMDLCFLPNP